MARKRKTASAPPQRLSLQGTSIPLHVRRGRGQRMKLAFDGPTLVLTHPTGELDDAARAFIDTKTAWILRHHARHARQAARIDAFRERRLEETLVLGTPRRIVRRHARARSFRLGEDQLLIAAPPAQWEEPAALIKSALRQLAKVYLQRRLDRWAARTELDYAQLRIKDAATRWGSCSTKRNINLNWHLVMLEESIIDYLIVHELMHLHEMNHSPAFWNWVQHYLPGYKREHDRLNDHQWLLGIYD